MSKTFDTSLAIIGAGPVGLACGIEASKAGLDYIIIDKGSVTDNIRRFPVNMTFFSTPELLSIGDIPFSCAGLRPSRVEALEYYMEVAKHYDLKLLSHSEVVSAEKQGNKFFLKTENDFEINCDTLIFACGYYDTPNVLNIPGEELAHVSHYYSEAFEYVGSEVVVVGGRNSAVEAALDLYRHNCKVHLVHKESSLGENVKAWIRPDIDNRIANSEINSHFNCELVEIRQDSVLLRDRIDKIKVEMKADFVFLLTGYKPDIALPEQLGVEFHKKTLEPKINSETFETNTPGIFIAGSPVAGTNTGKIFIENGREHAKVIIEHLVGLRQS